MLRVGKGKGRSESESETCRVVSLVVLWVPVGVIWATSSLDPARSNKKHQKKKKKKKKIKKCGSLSSSEMWTYNAADTR